jgi:hypothetical protein
MKAFCTVLVSLLLFTACHRQPVKPADKVHNPSPMVIDYPAGVMISAPQRATSHTDRNLSFAERVLSPHSIPIVDSSVTQMVFVKLNGERISIAMEDMAGKYDIILFNAVSNPVPLRINDLQNAYEQIFNNKPIAKRKNRSNTIKLPDTKPIPDTVPYTDIRQWLSELRNRGKKVVITTADIAASGFQPRAIPGIEWVEQRVDTRTLLKIHFENDLITYANTDRYFTNGVNIELQSARLGRSPFQKLMVPYNHKAFVTYTLSMVQDMYTPTDTRIAPTLSHDRPYSSYLYFGLRKTSADAIRKLKISSEVDAGYIGPYSPGSYMQTVVHKAFPTNDKPLGWETQINTDIILNYTIKVQKALIDNKNVSLLAGTDIKAGTLYNNAGAGLQFQAGKAEPVFGLAVNESWPRCEYYFFANTHVSYVAYNALLQGGLFNHDNVFTLKGDEIQRVVATADAGIHFRYKGVGIEVAQHYLSPEYKGGFWHKWGRMSLVLGL